MKPFLKKFLPKEQESVYSFLYRIAENNYFENIGYILSDEMRSYYFRYNLNYIKEDKKPSLELMVASLNQNINNLILNKYDELLFPESWSGSKADRRIYFKKQIQYCPYCIKEDLYHRLFWDISLVTVCTKHNVYLIGNCHDCNKKIHLSRLMVDSCACGCVLSTVPVGEKVNKQVFEAQKALQGLLLGALEQVEVSNGDFLSSDEYFYLFLSFCHSLDNLSNDLIFNVTKRQVRKINFNFNNKEPRDVNMMSVITTVAHQLVTHPYVFLPSILALIEKGSKHARHIKYREIKKIVQHPKGDIYHEVFSHYLNETAIDRHLNLRLIIPPKPILKKYFSKLEVRKILKSDSKVIDKLCKDGLLSVQNTKLNGRETILIERESIEDYIKLKKYYTMSDVIRVLGLNEPRVRELVDRDILLPSHRPKEFYGNRWYFKKENVHKFLNEIINKCNKLNRNDPNWLSFHESSRIFLYFDIGKLDLLCMILKDELTGGFLEGQENINGIYIFRKDIDAYLENIKKQEKGKFGYKPAEIARLCNVGKEKVKYWIAKGDLRVTHEKNNSNGSTTRYIKTEQVINLLMETKSWSKDKVEKYLMKAD